MISAKVLNSMPGSVQGVDDLFEVSPAGSPVHRVAEDLKRLLVQRFGYECEVIRLSQFIEQIDGAVTHASPFERAQELIGKGNDLRRRFGHSVLADLAISRIAKAREKVKVSANDTRYAGRRVCYIVDSIKNSDEYTQARLS